MDGVLFFIQTHLPFLINHKYLFIYLGTSIEGLNSTILAGFLASVGAVSLWPVLFLCVIGAMTNGFMWYTVGYFAGSKPIDKWGRKDEKGRKIIEKVEDYFHRYSGRAIIITKLTWSLTIATMITAGSLKYDLKKFTLYNFIGSMGWAFMVVFFGFFFGQSYKFLIGYLTHIMFGLLFLVGAIILIYILKRIFNSFFIRSIFLRDKLNELSNKFKDGMDKFLSDKE